jgi:hypothetical protein
MVKKQLLQRGSNCRILHEEDVTIANGRMKGRDIMYVAGTIAHSLSLSPPALGILITLEEEEEEKMEETHSLCFVRRADAQPVGAQQQQQNKGLAMQQMRCLQRVYLFGNTSYVLLFQAMDATFEDEWPLAEPIIRSFQFFSS